MVDYKLILMDINGRLIAQELFRALDDVQAQKNALIVLEACRDVARECEVWRGETLVARGVRKASLFSRPVTIKADETGVVEVLDRLQRGHSTVARSRRLSRLMDKLRRQGLR